MRIPDGRTRRSVLGLAAGATAAAALGGCDLLGPGPQWRPADPLTALYLATVALAGRYDATIAAHDGLSSRLTPIRDAHRAHAEALARELALPGPGSGDGPEPSVSGASALAAVPDEAPAALVALRTAETAAATAATDACLTAPSWRAQMLGSVAACRASHLEALA